MTKVIFIQGSEVRNAKQGSKLEIGDRGVVSQRWGVCFESGIDQIFFEIFFRKNLLNYLFILYIPRNQP